MYRGFIIKKKFLDLKKKTITIEKVFKGYLIRKKFKNLIIKITKIQSIFRGFLYKREFHYIKRTLSNLIKILSKHIKTIFKYLTNQFKKKKSSIIFFKIQSEKKNNKFNQFFEEGIYNEINLIKILKENGKGIKSFPRPYCEIGNSYKILKKIIDKSNNIGDDLYLCKAFDIKYSGITSQLILNVSEKKYQLNKLVSKESIIVPFNEKNDNDYDYEHDNDKIKDLAEDIFETKMFLKSKNITSEIVGEKTVINNRHYFTKKYVIDEVKKISLIQKNIKKFLKNKKNKHLNKENSKSVFLSKVKVFRLVLKECIVNNVRKNVFELFGKIRFFLGKKEINLNNCNNDIKKENKKNSFSEKKNNNNKLDNIFLKKQQSNPIKKNIDIDDLKNEINKINTLRKKKISIQTNIIDEPTIEEHYKTNENIKYDLYNNINEINNNENNLNYNPINEFITIRRFDSDESKKNSRKNSNQRLKKEISFESSGSIIFNDKEIYVNINNIIPFKKNDKSKVRSNFFNVIVNNIKK